MIARCESIEARTEEGELIEAGVEWNEGATLTEALISAIGNFACLLFLIALVLAILVSVGVKGGAALPLFAGSAVMFGLACGIFWLGEHMPGRKRVLVFTDYNEIVIPHGVCGASGRGDRLLLSHSEIVSIEAEQVVFPKGENPTAYTHGVRMFFRGGQVVHIAKDIEPDHAHMIAVRLSQSLSGLREEMAIASMGMGAVMQEQASTRAREPERVID